METVGEVGGSGQVRFRGRYVEKVQGGFVGAWACSRSRGSVGSLCKGKGSMGDQGGDKPTPLRISKCLPLKGAYPTTTVIIDAGGF